MAASRAATWIAFGTIVRRGLTTVTPTRYCPRQAILYPPRHTLVSKASKGRKLPKNHFTSHQPRRSDDASSHQNELGKSQEKSKSLKRKAGQRTQSPSLRRVAVEAQRSRSSLIKGHGKTRHVDPEVETRDVTAYCAAETYDIHVARELLREKGWKSDPYGTDLFPQVLHVRVPSSTDSFPESAVAVPDQGDVFVFPSGTIVTWHVPEKTARHIVESVLVPSAGNSHPDKLEAEDLEYLVDPTNQNSEIVGDTIILGTKATEEQQPDTPRPEVDTILAKIAFSSALARSTKLAVLENSLANYFTSTHDLTATLSRGSKPRFTRAFILRKTGELLSIRAQLNLYSELTDSLPDLFWDSPYELGLENYYDQASHVLDVNLRIKALNEKINYASEIAAVLRERLSERHGHLLEWIIIWLILIEVAYGSLHLWRERLERLDPVSNSNLMREWLLRELERIDGGGRRR